MNEADLTSLIRVPHSSNVSNAAHWNGWWAWLASSLFACWLPLSIKCHLHKRSWMGFSQQWAWGGPELWLNSWIIFQPLLLWIMHVIAAQGLTILPSSFAFLHKLSFTHNTVFVLHYFAGCMFNYELISFLRKTLLAITLFSSNP